MASISPKVDLHSILIYIKSLKMSEFGKPVIGAQIYRIGLRKSFERFIRDGQWKRKLGEWKLHRFALHSFRRAPIGRFKSGMKRISLNKDDSAIWKKGQFINLSIILFTRFNSIFKRCKWSSQYLRSVFAAHLPTQKINAGRKKSNNLPLQFYQEYVTSVQ